MKLIRKPGPRPSNCPWCNSTVCSHCRCTSSACDHSENAMCKRERYKRRLVCNTCQKRKSKNCKQTRSDSIDGQESVDSINENDLLDEAPQGLAGPKRSQRKRSRGQSYDTEDYDEEVEEEPEPTMQVAVRVKEEIFVTEATVVNTWCPAAFTTLIAAAKALDHSLASTA